MFNPTCLYFWTLNGHGVSVALGPLAAWLNTLRAHPGPRQHHPAQGLQPRVLVSRRDRGFICGGIRTSRCFFSRPDRSRRPGEAPAEGEVQRVRAHEGEVRFQPHSVRRLVAAALRPAANPTRGRAASAGSRGRGLRSQGRCDAALDNRPFSVAGVWGDFTDICNPLPSASGGGPGPLQTVSLRQSRFIYCVFLSVKWKN